MIENNYNLYNDGAMADKAVVKKSYSTPQIQVLVAKEEILGATNLSSESNSGYYS